MYAAVPLREWNALADAGVMTFEVRNEKARLRCSWTGARPRLTPGAALTPNGTDVTRT